jgi:hypothetical protein
MILRRTRLFFVLVAVVCLSVGNAQFGVPKHKTVQIDAATGEPKSASGSANIQNTKRPKGSGAKKPTESDPPKPTVKQSDVGVPTLDEKHDIPASLLDDEEIEEEEEKKKKKKKKKDEKKTTPKAETEKKRKTTIPKAETPLQLVGAQDWVIEKLKSNSPDMADGQAKELATLIASIRKEQDNKYLSEGASQTARTFARDFDAPQIVEHLIKAMESLKYVEALFMAAEQYPENQSEILEEMKQAGMVPPERETEFEEDSKLLQEHVRRTAYISIVALSVAGGYIPETDIKRRKTDKVQEKKSDPAQDRPVQGGTASADTEVIRKLKGDAPDLAEQVLNDLAAVIYSAQHNERQEELKEKATKAADELRRELKHNPRKIVEHLVKALEGLEHVEALFTGGIDPLRILEQMISTGIIPADKKEFFTENPEELKNQVRATSYFTFVSLAMAGGYLE